jgi:hypothetical protein
MITFFDRLNAGLQQLMAGARKFALKYIARNDLCSLTRDASEISGIPYVMDADKEEVEKILKKNGKASSKVLNLNIEALIRSKALTG